MIKSIRHKGLKAFYETGSKAGINADHANKINLFLSMLAVTDRVDNLQSPVLRLHQLKGDMKGHWAVDVSGAWRITFKFINGEAIDVNYVQYH
jgi:proteic killer suppression protein